VTLVVEASVATEKKLRNTRKIGKDKYLTMSLIRGADRGRYSRLMNDLKNQFTMGHNNYPRNITAAYNLFLNYRTTIQPQKSTRIINDSEIGMSKKQKLNTKSSMECELVGVDDASPQMLWTPYFVEEQGYGVEASILNQDNLNAILLKKNGKASSGKRTKHINVRYFFIKDRIGSGEITVKHCPATEMLADHFTKPLQGTMFRKFRADIQGVPIDMCDADVGWDRPCAINK
jgi:hypothetical protein